MRAAAPLVGAMLMAGCSDMAVKCCDTVAVRLMSDLCLGDETTCSIIELEKQLEIMRHFQSASQSTTERFCITGTVRAVGSPPVEPPPPVTERCDDFSWDDRIATTEVELQRLRALRAQSLN